MAAFSGIGIAKRLLSKKKKDAPAPAPMPVTPAGPTPRELAEKVQTRARASSPGGKSLLGVGAGGL